MPMWAPPLMRYSSGTRNQFLEEGDSMFCGKRAQAVRKKSKEGASLAIVVCVSAFLVAFALAMVYTAGLMLSGANQRLDRERCIQLAKSFARTLDRELLRYGSPEEAKTDSSDSFYLFACRFLEDSRYAVYNPDHPEDTAYHYEVRESTLKEEYGEITVVLYKESDTEGDTIGGTFLHNASDSDFDPLGTVAGSVNHHTFTVQVTASIGGVGYTYATAYQQMASYDEDAVFFTSQGGD